MVFFFECSDPQYIVYMGRDKFENDELIKNGWPEDIWFHVDDYSSAHVYLRLPPGTVDLFNVKDKDEAKQRLVDAVASVPETILMEMAQLTKANSIEGCKLAEVDVVYTPFLNLRKEERMDTGQVGFKDESFRKVLKKVPKDKEIIKNLEKTRVERKEAKSYASLQTLEMTSNAEVSKTGTVEECKELEDDFM
eukprot:TRINITY_DN9403_c0_g1_i2.p1 TRINITY_DN9403_c0_g1~~TRINITY_DN9403_c0_g1_i2.p1  ORF type:complete len:193 (+),score=52.22 TRINITY_DN9403_c0_g1_i2:57-635(+)